MKKFLLLSIALLPLASHAGDREDFEAYKKQMQGGMQQQKEEYRAYTEKMQREWKSYLDDIRKNFGSVDFTSDKKWVNYSKDKKARVALDNDKGVVTLEFVASDKGKGVKEAKALLNELSKEANPFSSQPALTENVPVDKLRPEDARPVGHASQGGAQVYRLTVPMNEDRQMNNEVQVAESVRDMTEKYHVPYDIAMAIIKAESNFNVGAGTRKGALDIRDPAQYENSPWGLMQVVPKRSGRIGLKRAQGKNRQPTADELLDPKTNLEIGVAYLAVLQESEFSSVKDEDVRERLMIAAYRDGPEKVYTLFSRSGKKAESLAVVNHLSSDEVARILARKGTGTKLPDGKYVANVEKERDNYRVTEQEKQQYEQEAEKISANPELRAVVNQWLGTPYRLGGTTHNAIDCSGFTMNVYSQAYKMKIPRTSELQYTTYGGSTVGSQARKEGDLIFFNTLHNGNPVSHVGIWLDNSKFVHASSSKGVVISNINETYYRTRYVGANRPVGQ